MEKILFINDALTTLLCSSSAPPSRKSQNLGDQVLAMRLMESDPITRSCDATEPNSALLPGAKKCALAANGVSFKLDSAETQRAEIVRTSISWLVLAS